MLGWQQHTVENLCKTYAHPIPRYARDDMAICTILPHLRRPDKFPKSFGFLPLTGLRGVSKRMPEVIIHDDESFERALKRFKKKCEKAGILSDLRKHRHFEKPSEKRKRKMNAAVRKTRRGPRVPRV
jgi:small subunit ribosomal protein S21